MIFVNFNYQRFGIKPDFIIKKLERTLFAICNFFKTSLKVKTFKTSWKTRVLKVLKLRLLRPQSSLKVKTSKIILGIFLKTLSSLIFVHFNWQRSYWGLKEPSWRLVEPYLGLIEPNWGLKVPYWELKEPFCGLKEPYRGFKEPHWVLQRIQGVCLGFMKTLSRLWEPN